MNLKQFADFLNLSPTTVSRALNGFSDVGRTTRERVAEAAVLYNYRPNPRARQLALGRKSISLIFDGGTGGLNGEALTTLIGGIAGGLEPLNVDLLLTMSRPTGPISLGPNQAEFGDVSILSMPAQNSPEVPK